LGKTETRRIASLFFLATFLGSLFGVAVQLTDVLDTVEKVAVAINPSPKLRIVGSHTVLGRGLPLSAEWQKEFKELTRWEEYIPMVD
jgi:hypothetical protein